MPNEVIIIGAGGHARVIADIIRKSGDIVLGFLDDYIIGKVNGLPILGRISDACKFEEKTKFVIGIGDNQIRKKMAESNHLQWYVAIHPSAIISCDVSIEEGTVIMAGVVINTNSMIGKHCIINTCAVIEHDCKISDYVHVSPHATLCGTVSVGENSHIGAGATVINNLTITADSIIGAGAVVVRDITNSGKYIGVPAVEV